MRKCFAAVAAVAVVSTAGSAAAQASGSYFITNNSSEPVALVANSLANNGTAYFSRNIDRGTTAYAKATQTSSRNVYVGTFSYQNLTGAGCNFTTTVIRSASTGRYSFTFSATPRNASQAAVCTMTPSNTNAVTGVYSTNVSMIGF